MFPSSTLLPPNTSSHREPEIHVPPLNPKDIFSRQWRNSPKGDIWSALEDWFVLNENKEFALKESLAAKDPLSNWTILHFACAHDAPQKLVRKLLEALPGGLSLRDSEGRTPLHLACENGVSIELAEYLVSEAAKGFLLETVDGMGRTPMHTVLDQAHLKGSAGMLELLLGQSFEPKKIEDKEGRFPLACLKKFKPENCSKEEMDNIVACFEAYIASVQFLESRSTRKDPDFYFLALLDELPWWLWERAASSSTMQTLVNKVFCSGGVTQFLVMRFMSLVIILACLPLVWADYNEQFAGWLIPYLLVGASACLLFEKGIPMMTRAVKGNIFCRLQRHPAELVYILLGMYTLVISIFMLTMTVREGSPFSSEEATFWRALTVISIAMTSWALVAFFRLVSVDFAQITNGVVTTAKKIMAFMLAFTIVLVAFAEMLYISTTGTEECTRQSDFCNFFDALLKVYTMSVGEVSEDDIPKNGFSIFLYVVFVYAVVLLLANVLAFIIGNDIWSKEQTSQGFWLNRMNYLAEVGSVFASKKREINFFGGRCEIDLCCEVDCSAASSRTWQKLTSVFEDKGLGTLSPMFWLTMVLRFLSAIALSLWVLIGLGFFGAFWPASVREFLFWVPTKEEKAQANKDVAAKNTTQSVLELELHQVRKDMNAMEEKLSNEIKSMEEKLSKVLALLENQQKTLPAQT